MIPFNKPFIIGRELDLVRNTIREEVTAGNGYFTNQCQIFLQNTLKHGPAFLTHSCTAALEITALLINIQPGDEVIMPSYTFVSCATAFALRGATIKFAEINPETLNADPVAVEEQITPRTKAVVMVHYAGVASSPEKMQAITKRHNVYLIEDAAHALGAYKGNTALGTFGDLATLSFHETKPIQSGEGGALIINNPEFIERAEIIRDKGTNRGRFNRGETAYYEWVDIGSSYAPSEITAAFLYGQLEQAEKIIQKRVELWNQYYDNLVKLQDENLIRLPVIPEFCRHNGSVFYLLCKDEQSRNNLLNHLNNEGIKAVFHYFPLHQSTYYKKHCNNHVSLPITESISKKIIRLPLFYSLTEKEQEFIITKVREFFKI